jgi:tetratricopeptide (TPR) repeat protein
MRILLLVLALIFQSAATLAQSDSVQVLIKEGNALLDQQEYAAVISMCESAVDAHKGDAALNEMYLLWGTAHYKKQERENAIEVFEEGLEVFPKDFDLWYTKATYHVRMKDDALALTSFEKAIQLKPTDASIHNSIGRLQLDANQKIPALMTMLLNVSMEPEGSSAESNIMLIDKLLNGAIIKTGKNSISINMDLQETAEDDTITKPNDFKNIYNILIISSLIGSGQKQTQAEQFRIRIGSMSSSMTSGKDDNFGFYWEFYAPYFMELAKNEHIDAFTYIVLRSTDQKEVQKWIKKNPEKIKAFYEWSNNYAWPESIEETAE